MAILLFSLVFFVFLVWGLKTWKLMIPWVVGLWMVSFVGCSLYCPLPLTEMTGVFSIGFLVFCQDLKTRYFSRLWFVVALLVLGLSFLVMVSPLWRLAGLGLGLMSFFFVKHQSLGLADAIGLGCLGFSLGLSGLCEVVMIASFGCLVYGFMSAERLLPFLSFLAWAYCLVFCVMVG